MNGFLLYAPPLNVDNPPIFTAFLWRCCCLRAFKQCPVCVYVRYKRKGLNQVGHSSVPDQKQHQQHNTQQQHDLYWNKQHEQSKISVFIFSLQRIRFTENFHKHRGLKFITIDESEVCHSNQMLIFAILCVMNNIMADWRLSFLLRVFQFGYCKLK